MREATGISALRGGKDADPTIRRADDGRCLFGLQEE